MVKIIVLSVLGALFIAIAAADTVSKKKNTTENKNFHE